MIQLDEYFMQTGDRNEGTDKAFIASLSEYEFDLNISEISKMLKLSKSYLRSWRKNMPIGDGENGNSTKGLNLIDIEPWKESVSGEQLFSTIDTTIRSFLIAPDQTSRIMAIWSALTYLADDVDVFPILAFTSPTKRSGKTTALEITRRLSKKSIMASSITPAAIFRTVDRFHPTLLIDEADTIFKESNDLRTLINASFTRNSAIVVRVQGNDLEPRSFSSFSPKAIALIGQLPDTVADRSIILTMRRRKPEEEVERLRADRDMGFSDIKSMIARWILDNKVNILKCDPSIPSNLNDRQADCWRELFKIADTIGGEWPSQIRNDAIRTCQDTDEDTDTKTLLLEDIRSYFMTIDEKKQVESKDIVEYLLTLEERPWAEWRKGKGFTVNALASLLRGFSVRPKSIRFGFRTAKGYVVDDFNEVFSRYLLKENTVTN